MAYEKSTDVGAVPRGVVWAGPHNFDITAPTLGRPLIERRESNGQPVSDWTLSCSFCIPVMERMIVYLSATLASSGINSQISMPGTLVAIGLNSPRYSFGASGFRSNISIFCG